MNASSNEALPRKKVRTSARARAARRSSARGFSLMELMLVVLMVSILAMIAIPSMSRAREDQHAYEDAASIAELFRSARARAVGRGAAILVKMTSNSTDRGTFSVYEAVGLNPGGVGGSNMPLSSCRAPTSWASLPATPLDGVNLNGLFEQEVSLTASILVGSVATPAAFICFTPGGRTYFVNSTIPDFNSASPMISPIEIKVSRPKGIVRRVIVPSNGSARIYSQ